MSSLADLPQLVGFFSYARDDDEGSSGHLSKLRERIQEELRAQLGRTRRDFRLWQDKAAIAHGKLWEDEIKTAIAEATFFIPIVTPTAIRSQHCKFEFESFLAREQALGRNDLVFPIHYVLVSALQDEARWRQDRVLSIIGSRQYIDWLSLRHLDVGSTEVRVAVERFCANIVRALQQSWLSPEEAAHQQAEAEAQRRADEERQTASRSGAAGRGRAPAQAGGGRGARASCRGGATPSNRGDADPANGAVPLLSDTPPAGTTNRPDPLRVNSQACGSRSRHSGHRAADPHCTLHRQAFPGSIRWPFCSLLC